MHETAEWAWVTVTRSGGSSGILTVAYSTCDSSLTTAVCGGVSGTATSGSRSMQTTDYETTSGVLTFNTGVTALTFGVKLWDDICAEGSESIELRLSGLSHTGVAPCTGIGADAACMSIDRPAAQLLLTDPEDSTASEPTWLYLQTDHANSPPQWVVTTTGTATSPSGNFSLTLTYAGLSATTLPIVHNAADTVMKATLEALPLITVVTVVRAAGATTGTFVWTITMTDSSWAQVGHFLFVHISEASTAATYSSLRQLQSPVTRCDTCTLCAAFIFRGTIELSSSVQMARR